LAAAGAIRLVEQRVPRILAQLLSRLVAHAAERLVSGHLLEPMFLRCFVIHVYLLKSRQPPPRSRIDLAVRSRQLCGGAGLARVWNPEGTRTSFASAPTTAPGRPSSPGGGWPAPLARAPERLRTRSNKFSCGRGRMPEGRRHVPDDHPARLTAHRRKFGG